MGQPDQAISAIKQELKRKPNNPAAYEFLGFMTMSKEQYNDAIIYYKKALKIAPKHHISYYNLGISLMKLGKTDQAITAVSNAVKLTPLPEYPYQMGELYEQKGEFESARMSYQQLLNLQERTNDWHHFAQLAEARRATLKGKY